MAPERPFEEKLNKWNWGAFVLNWVWCIGNMGFRNGGFKAFLMFVPGVNLVMLFLLGARGNRWAWKVYSEEVYSGEIYKGEQENLKSQEDFLQTQKIWSRVGLGVLIIIPTFIILILMVVMTLFRQSEPFELSLQTVSQHPAAQIALGEPVVFDGWFISGSINLANDTGSVDLTYDVSGPIASGSVRFMGTLSDEIWHIDHHQLTITLPGTVIDLGKGQ